MVEIAAEAGPSLLAQAEPDVLGRIQSAWQRFIDAGQLWALLIGFGLGYLFRNLSS